MLLSTWPRLGSVLILLLFSFHCIAETYYTFVNGGSSGQWNNAATWTTDPSGLTSISSAVPGNNDVINILNGYTVLLSANVASTGLVININSGGILDLSTFTISGISTLAGTGTLRIGAGYFPAVTSNTFASNGASGALVEYYDFTGTLPVSINYPNLTFRNTTATDHTITFSSASAYSLTLTGSLNTVSSGTGTLTVVVGSAAAAINMTVNRNINIGSSTIIRAGNFNTIHTLTVNGNFTNNGTVDFSNGTQYAASTTGAVNLFFSGGTDNTLACNSTTDLYNLTVNKGSGSTSVLSVTSTNTSNLNFFTNQELFVVTNGTLRLGSNIQIPRVRGSGTGNYDVGTSATSPMLWIDGASVNTNAAALVVYGKFRITAGDFTCTGGQGTVIREEGQYLIDGGIFTTEKFRPSTTSPDHRGSFIMTGGVVNATGTGSNGDYARFSIPYPEQVFIMSGGTINVSNPQDGSGADNGGIHLGSKSSNYQVTGGTFNAVLSGGADFFNICSTVPFWNLNISRTGGTPTTARLNGIGSLANTVTAAQPLIVLNDFNISGANSPVFNSSNLNVTVGGNFNIDNGATYTPGTNTTIFDGVADQQFSNSGTITSGLFNLTVDKPAEDLVLAGSAATYTVRGTLRLTGGVLNDGGKTIFAQGNIYNEATHTGTGNITLSGTSTQTISGDGTGILGNVVLTNTSVPGVNLTASMSISGILTLAGTGNSLFDINQYRLSLTSTAVNAVITTGSSFSSAKMIRTLGLQSDGGIEKTYGNLQAFTFPCGTASTYTPSVIQITSAPATYGNITVRPVASRHPLVVAGNTNNLTWYWKVTSTGFSGLPANGISHTYSYVESSVSPGGDDSNYIAARYNPTIWSVVNDPASVDEVNNQVLFTGVGYIDGEFTAGIPSAFGIVRTFYSKRNGNWNDTNPGTTPWSNDSHSGADANAVPTSGDQVYIGNGSTFNHTVTITSNNQSSGGLEINTGSTLDIGTTTGHNFGAFTNSPIGGSGTLRISSSATTAQFPAGDFGNFIRENGGTVEYYSTGTQDFTIPVTSAAPTLLPLITYRNLVLTPSTGRFITLPNLDLRIYQNLTVQGQSATGVARLNNTSVRTMTVDGNTIIQSGNLQFRNNTAQTVTVGGSLTVAPGAVFDVATTGTAVTNLLVINGSIVNNGTLDLAATGGRICNTTFTGSANATLTGIGAVTDFNILTVDKGSSQAPVLEVNASAFTLSGASPSLVLTNGTFRLTSSQTITIANNVDFDLGETARLSANGGTIQITGGNGIDLLLSGTLEVLNGTINIGTTANDNAIEYAATGTPSIVIGGGVLNVRGQIRRSIASTQGALTYSQTNGVVSTGVSSAPRNTRGVFEILNTSSSFVMTGGTLAVNRGTGGTSIADIYLFPTSSSVSGGTIETGTLTTGQNIDINSSSPVFNVSVAGTSTTARLESNGLVIRGSLSINAGNVFNANSLNVSIAGNFSNMNTSAVAGVTTGGYQAGSISQTTTFNGSASSQTFTGVAGNLTNFGNLVISNTFPSGNVSLATGSNVRVNGTLILSSGTLAGDDNTITAIGTVSNSSVHTSTGAGSVSLAGTSTQLITGNGSGRFGSVILDNPAGARFLASQEITGVLTFSNGLLNIDAFRLTLSNPSFTSLSGFSSTRYIVTGGNLSDEGIVKTFAASSSGSFVFPAGVTGKYTPAAYSITTGAAGGTVRLKPVNSKHPNATGPGTAFINYYWNVTSTGTVVNSVTHTYTYVAGDQSGDPFAYRDARFQGGAWFVGITAGNPDIVARTITFTNTNLTADYTAGEETAFVNPTTYTSIASGSWDSDLSVWDIDPPGTNLGPPPGSFIIISEGHTVTIPGNGKRMASVDIRGRLHIGTTTAHDFGTVTTTGAGERTLQTQSSTFPGGDFSAFIAAGGGTVEYNGVVTLPTQNVYNNLSFTGSGTKTLPTANLLLNGNLTVSQGTVTGAINNGDITLASTTGDFTNNGIFVSGTGALVVGRNLTNSGAGTQFTSGSGSAGLIINGNLINTSNATFNCSTDSIGVRGAFTNSATFNAASGAIRVTSNFLNSGGTFAGNTGIFQVTGNFTNNATFTAGTGAITVRGTYLNSGAGAVHNGSGNSLTITGNFSNEADATFNAGSGSVSTRGNWTNGGTFNSGTGTVTFNGTGAQLLTGTTSFHNLTRMSGGTLTLNSSINASGILNLTGGNIITANNTINLTNTATQPVSVYSASSFVDGRLSIAFPSTSGAARVFPVGKASTYRPVTIQQTNASALPVIRVEMINTPPTGSYPPDVGIISEARYYSIDLLSGTISSPTIEISFNTNGPPDENVFLAGNTKVLRASSASGPWTNEGGTGVFAPAFPAGYAVSGATTIGNPSYFALAYITAVLPVSLGPFTGFIDEGVVNLSWNTFSEKENHYFTIERSDSELNFDSIGFVTGAGNSQARKNYSFRDADPLPGLSYYRLKQTDFDGTFTYARNLVSINNTGSEPYLLLYPNPGEFNGNILLRIKNSVNKHALLTITDAYGRTLYSSTADLTEGLDVSGLNTSAPMKPGTYIVRVVSQGKAWIEKLIIH